MSDPPSDDELRSALERHLGASRPIVRIERRASAYQTSFPLEELDVRLADGTELALVFKDLSREALPEPVRRAKPAFLYDPLREIGTYRSILGPAGLGPVCHGADADPQAGRYWLFLERVAGRELYRVGDFGVWEQTARWLAALHTRFAGLGEELTGRAPLLVHDGDFYRVWMRRAREFLRESVVPAPDRQRFEWLAVRHDRVIERLTSLPATFLHGEFYASNVLVQETDTGLRVCPVDWEMAAVGPGLTDLAALVAGKWTAEQRAALAAAYESGLDSPLGGALPELLDFCRLQVAVQWLGWSPNWTPPPEHAQDWLGEALGLSERLLV